MAAHGLGKGYGVVAVATQGLHIAGQASLFFTDEFKDQLVQHCPVIATITPHQLQLTERFPIGAVIGTIDVEAGGIEV